MASTAELFLFTVVCAFLILFFLWLKKFIQKINLEKLQSYLFSSRTQDDFTPVPVKTAKSGRSNSKASGLQLDNKSADSEGDFKEGELEIDSLRLESTLGSAKEEWRDKHELFRNDDSEIPIDFSRVEEGSKLDTEKSN